MCHSSKEQCVGCYFHVVHLEMYLYNVPESKAECVLARVAHTLRHKQKAVPLQVSWSSNDPSKSRVRFVLFSWQLSLVTQNHSP